MIKKPVTIKDIAQKLKIHHTTVSRALRNHPHISRETREKVLFLAEELDYHPNSIAHSFKNRRSKTIGVVVPTIKNDFFATVIDGIENVTYKARYNIILCQSDEMYERELLSVRTLVSNLVAGIIIAVSQTTQTVEHLKNLKNRGIHLVLFDRIFDGIEASRVIVDDFEGAFCVVEHLIKSGYKMIAHLAGPEYISVSRDRYRGYAAALKKFKFPLQNEFVIFGGFKQEDGRIGFQKLMEKGVLPDAVFAVNDRVAVGAMTAIKENGYKIPDDIALAGFSNDVLTSVVDPPLTTVDQKPYEMGEIAAKMILQGIENINYNNIMKEKVLKTKLIVRRST